MRRQKTLKAEIYQKAEIHSCDGNVLDDDGEEMVGFYWRLMDNDENPISKLMGPYATFHECHIACERAWQQGDY